MLIHSSVSFHVTRVVAPSEKLMALVVCRVMYSLEEKVERHVLTLALPTTGQHFIKPCADLKSLGLGQHSGVTGQAEAWWGSIQGSLVKQRHGGAEAEGMFSISNLSLCLSCLACCHVTANIELLLREQSNLTGKA